MNIISMRKAWLLVLCMVLISSFIVTYAKEKESEEDVSPPTIPPSLSEHVVQYHIDVTLDAKRQKLIGTQIVTWKHPGQEVVGELYFHLYPNAFKSKRNNLHQRIRWQTKK